VSAAEQQSQTLRLQQNGREQSLSIASLSPEAIAAAITQIQQPS
jgi:hypothetical protein